MRKFNKTSIRVFILLGLLTIFTIAFQTPQIIQKDWQKFRAHPELVKARMAEQEGTPLKAISAFHKALIIWPDSQEAQSSLTRLLTIASIRIIPPIRLNYINAHRKLTDITDASSQPQSAVFNNNIPAPVPRPTGNANKRPNTANHRENPTTAELAISAMERTPTPKYEISNSSNIYDLNTRGFEGLGKGQNDKALHFFNQSLAINPDQSLIQRQVGYLNKAAGDYVEAARAFDHALKLDGLEPETKGILENEITDLTRRFWVNAYSLWRARALTPFELAIAGPSLGQSQSLLQTSYRPNWGKWANLHHLTLYSRLIWGYDGDSLDVNTRSLQGGVGVTARPSQKHNLHLTAERLIAIGQQSRDDWLLRTSWSAGDGFVAPYGRKKWLHWSIYGDASLINPAQPDFFLTGEGRVGIGFQPFDSMRHSLIPFIATYGTWQEAFGTTTLIENGLGLWFRTRFNKRPRRAYRSQFDLRAEYRTKITGNSASSSGFLLTLALRL